MGSGRIKSDRIRAYTRSVIDTPDGTKLDATTYHTNPNHEIGGVIVTHGLGRRFAQQYPLELSGTPDDAEKALAMELASRGFRSLIYSHRGHNGSGGALSFRDSIRDLEFVSERFAEEYEGNLFAAGFSMGGWATLHVAAKRPDLYQAVVPICAPNSMRDVLPDWMHGLIRTIIGNPRYEGLGRYVIAGVKIWVLNGGSALGFLKELATNPEEREKLFTHIGECRLPDRLHELYIDLVKSPDIGGLEGQIETPILLLHPEKDGLVYRKGEKDKYLDVFRRKAVNFQEVMIPGATHRCSRKGRSILEMETEYADMIAEFFLDHVKVGEPEVPAPADTTTESVEMKQSA